MRRQPDDPGPDFDPRIDGCAPSPCVTEVLIVGAAAIGIFGGLCLVALVVAMTLTVLGLWAE